ncbi:MAG: nucleoside hydrolase [Nocardioidaceae bacterium]
MATPILLDCDPGHDDAIAILLAYADPRVDLLGITTVAGNNTVDKCTLNARRVCTVAGIEGVPIAQGAQAPLARSLRISDKVHGASGLDGPEFGEPTVDVVGQDAVELMYDTLTRHPDPVTLVAVGPLTNVAWLLRKHPDAREHVRELVLMGGSTERGNATPYAEANIYVDPEAAEEVWRSGLEITMVGLNVTHQARVTPAVLERLRELGTPLSGICVELMTFFTAAYQGLFSFDSPPLHDPVAVARVIDSSVVRCVDAPVMIETQGEHTFGATVVDLHHGSGRADNTHVAMGLDQEPFWDMVVNAVRVLG